MSASTSLTTLESVKNYLGLAGSEHDAVLNALIASASEAIERYCNHEFLQKERTEYYDGHGSAKLILKHWPVVSVASIHDDLARDFGEETLISPEDYALDEESGMVLLLTGRFQDGARNVRVNYTAGYLSIPGDVEQAAKVLVAAWFNRGHQGGDGLSAESMGSYRADYDPQAWPPQVRQLLAPYRNPAI